ncbi:MAG TPA: 3-hydroxyacyl-ACP dehydratase FabZ family protein [Planctomycetota bacterium]|nr:3-hydroxyacyl-ACP dehydratase FabZ family protein [Planctomycetota bacterium]
MRWFWIDRITHLEKGKTAGAVKNVTLAEEHLHDHFPGYPVNPPSLMIEGMAQTGGILAGSAVNFRENIVLAKISRAVFHRLVRPGDQLLFESKLVHTGPDGHRAETTITCEGEPVAESSMMFVNLNANDHQQKDRDGVFVFTEGFMQLLRECPGFDPEDYPSCDETSGGDDA